MNLLSRSVKELLPELIEIRRHIHQYPELSHQEFETAKYIEKKAIEFGVYKIQRLANSSLSITIGPDIGDAVAFRADIDALPISEECTSQYKSKKVGVMHACGHDVHATIVLGLIPVLLRFEPYLKRPIKLIFQQAEESHPSGAPLVINDGALEIPNVTEIYGIHVWPYLETGKIALKTGALMGSIDGLSVRINSKDSPDDHERSSGVDAIRITAYFLRQIDDLMHGRSLSDLHPSTISIGFISGGSSPNRFVDSVELKGTLRALSTESREEAINRIEQAIADVNYKFNADINLNIASKIRPVLINSEECIGRIYKVIRGLPTVSVEYLEHPLHCSEDFGWYLEESKGAYILLGCKGGEESGHPLHSPLFDVDEQVIEIGVSLLANIALNASTDISDDN